MYSNIGAKLLSWSPLMSLIASVIAQSTAVAAQGQIDLSMLLSNVNYAEARYWAVEMIVFCAQVLGVRADCNQKLYNYKLHAAVPLSSCTVQQTICTQHGLLQRVVQHNCCSIHHHG